jgi:ankyrin repeat protein
MCIVNMAFLDACQSSNLDEIKSIIGTSLNESIYLESDKKGRYPHVTGMFTQSHVGFTGAHWASYNDEVSILMLIYSKCPRILQIKTKVGQTCLHIAASSNSLRVVRFLLQLDDRSFVNETNNWGETPLHLAAASGRVVVVKELLNSGGDVLARDRWGRSPYQVISHKDNSTKRSVYIHA